MAVKDALGNRMKSYYENISKTQLIRKTPVALRIDGKAFHTFTRNLKKPFDDILMKSMQDTMKYLCANIQGCVFGYTQSDEITLILIDYQNLNSAAWFDYKVQKMCSIAASMATLAFNKAFCKNTIEHFDYVTESWNISDDELRYHDTLWKCREKGAMFDCRAFNIPKEEVANLVYWRQVDATKNSIQMVARTYFTQKELDKKNSDQMQEMLWSKYNVNWNNFPTEQKRGSACIKADRGWTIDHDMPIIRGENRGYVEKWIYVDKKE